MIHSSYNKSPSCLLQSAEAEYHELLRQFPQYGDCCLRLACIAKARGDTKVRLGSSVTSPAGLQTELFCCSGVAL